MKNLKYIKNFNVKINEFYGDGDALGDFTDNHSLENLNIDIVLDGLDMLKQHEPECYYKYFGKILKD